MKKQSEIEVLIRQYATFSGRGDQYSKDGREDLSIEAAACAFKIFNEITKSLDEVYNATVQA